VRVGLQAPGLAVPGLLTAAKDQAVAARLDSLWIPDHVIGLFPRSLWTTKYTALARVVKYPDAFVDPYSVLGYLVGTTRLSRLGLGVAVSDVARRHPVVVAQTFATLHWLSRGRMRLGLGTGAFENTAPFGIDQSRAVSRLEEGLGVIRALWDSGGQPVIRDGEFFPLQNALLDIPPYRGTRPPIFVAAHGPRMLSVTGRYGDAWMPAYLRPPKAYGESLNSIRAVASDAGRDPNRIVGSGLFFVLTASSPAAVEELFDTPLVKTWPLHLPAAEWVRLGASHPLGPDFNGEILPHLIDEPTALAWSEQVPDDLLRQCMLAGTPDEVSERLAEYGSAGLTHPILLNFAVPKRTKLALVANSSFAQLLRRVKRL
jgi:phthiodiolone/phenolphthiodiolone dimycocerosates ketoreductase